MVEIKNISIAEKKFESYMKSSYFKAHELMGTFLTEEQRLMHWHTFCEGWWAARMADEKDREFDELKKQMKMKYIHLPWLNRLVNKIIGGMTPVQKQKSIDDFQSNKNTRCMVANLAAGGVGHTLTAAHHLVFVEFDWVPGNNAQCIKRILRIGQKNHCIIHWIMVQDSIDSIIFERSISKQLDIDIMVDNKRRG